MKDNVFQLISHGEKEGVADKPLVSIITPVLNRVQYVEECILNIFNQTYPNIEHIFVDGSSTDGTLEVLSRYRAKNPDRVRYISESDNGLGDAVNKGWRMAKGEILGWIDTGDTYELDAIQAKEHKFLLAWFLGQPQNTTVSGYINHRWNGVTTLHFAKLCHGIITQNIDLPHWQHIVPAGEVTKYELLQCFAQYFRREDISITPGKATVIIDRTLKTTSKPSNQALWAAAGYSQPLSIPEMIAELACFDYKLGRL